MELTTSVDNAHQCYEFFFAVRSFAFNHFMLVLSMWKWFLHKQFLVCPYHSFKPQVWKRQPKLACRSLLTGERTWALCGLKTFHFNCFRRTFHAVPMLRFNLLEHSLMWLLSFSVRKTFRSLHSLHGKRFFSCCLSRVSRSVIPQSPYYSVECLCKWNFPRILGARLLLKGLQISLLKFFFYKRKISIFNILSTNSIFYNSV